MEERQLLEYCWKHKLFGDELKSINGGKVEVKDQGLYNRNLGSTFFNAKVILDGTLWVGNVMCLDRSDEWYERGCHKDSRFDNVVLVVCRKAGASPITFKDTGVWMAEVQVPELVRRNFEVLMSRRGMALRHWVSAVGYGKDGKFEIVMSNHIQNC